MSEFPDVAGRLVRDAHAARVLEIGAGAGATTLAIAEALANDGMLIAVERDATRATRTRERLAAAGHARRASVLVGDAARYLHKIAGPFDVIVWDAEASAYAALHDRLVRLLAPGALLVIHGAGACEDYNEALASDARLTRHAPGADDATIIATRRKDS
jgi:predicted O-methyltransferase YrrM